jgi:hypothetical protein
MDMLHKIVRELLHSRIQGPPTAAGVAGKGAAAIEPFALTQALAMVVVFKRMRTLDKEIRRRAADPPRGGFDSCSK